MASEDRHGDHGTPNQRDRQQAADSDSADSVALLPEPFAVNAEAVGLAAAAARAALRRTSSVVGRFIRAPRPSPQDPSHAVVEPAKVP